MFRKLKEIIQGWLLYAIVKPSYMIDRVKECKVCDKYKFGFCGVCGCYCKAKASIDYAKCDLDKW